MSNDLPGYDEWKTRLPAEPYCDDEDCTCTAHRMDEWCPIHGRDPDDELEKRRERDWDRELDELDDAWDCDE